jgi:cardiolipin synthase A/B
MSWLKSFEPYAVELLATAGTVLGPVLTVATIAWILAIKKNSTSAVAWCLVVFFLPVLGPAFFLIFGYQHVYRPLQRKRRHRRAFESAQPANRTRGIMGVDEDNRDTGGTDWESISRLAQRCGAYPVTRGNDLAFYELGPNAFEAMLGSIRVARCHIHCETFIFRQDRLGRRFLDCLAERARAGVEVRLLYDAMGTHGLSRRFLRSYVEAGGKHSVFLPLNPFRRRIQVNMRNHRKILVVDGNVGYIGGLNVGDEYLGEVARFGLWRDTHLCVRGPAVAGLQRTFIEDWDFAAHEALSGDAYFPAQKRQGPHLVQVIDSGPDREPKAIREMYFAAVLRARKRLWIASPYFVPDAGLLDALCLAANMGVDVRLLSQFHPDKWIPFFAARYYWNDVLEAGVKVYQYTPGMMHSKVVLVDGEWASVGSANFDNRSLYLNFETNCLIYSPEAVARLESAFLQDLKKSIRLDRRVYLHRPRPVQFVENACRLLSPIL